MMTPTKLFLFSTFFVLSTVASAQVNYTRPTQLPKVRAEIDFGLGKLTTKSTATNTHQKSYEEKLRNGTCIDASVVYFPAQTFGIGFKFGKFLTQNSLSDVTVTYPDSSQATGSISDNISLNFYGANFMWRFPSKSNANVFILSYAVGVVQYINKAVFIDPILIEGSSLSSCLNVGYDISVGPNLAIGVNASLWGGVLRSLDVTIDGQKETINLDGNHQVGLGRVTGVIGLKYSL